MGLAIRLTPLVRALVVANGAVFLLQLLADRFFPFTQWFGLVPALVARGAVWQLGTYMFLHGGLLHLL
ncbi:MAG: rhomboid family intramembrane serine protease, partial [bacterium]